MPEAKPEAPAPKPSPSRLGTPTLVLLGIVSGVGLANLVLASAVGSYLGQQIPDPQIAAGVVGVGAVVAVLVAPVGLGIAGLRQLIARGVKVRFARTLAALVVLWNGLLLAGLLTAAPEKPGALLSQRGTWIVDAARGVGPYGPAAIPVVLQRIDEATAIDTLAGIAPYLSNDTAAGLGAHWLVLLDGTRRGAAQESQIDVLIGRHGIDLAALRKDATALPEALDGRALVADVGAMMTGAAGPTFPNPQWTLPDFEPAAIDRTTIDLGGGRQARYEQGTWRLHLGDVAALTAGTAQQLEIARKAMAGLPSGPTGTVPMGTPPAGVAPVGIAPPVEQTPDGGAGVEAVDSYAAQRAVLATSLRGPAGLQSGTTAFFAEWPESLSREAAVAQAEALRASCAASAAEDPVFATEHGALIATYALPAAQPLDPVARAKLVARGRRYFADVLELCAPLLRQPAAAGPGGPVTDARRARWARLDAAEQAERASFAPDGDGLKATVGAESWRLLEEDGAWRVGLP